MKDEKKTKAQLLEELRELRNRVTQLEDRENTEADSDGCGSIDSVIDSLPLMLYKVGLDGKIMQCNQSLIDHLGYSSSAELVGKSVVETIFAPASREKAVVLFNRWLRGEELRDEELDVVTKDGEIYSVLLDLGTAYDQEHQPVCAIATQMDLRRLKEIEDDLSLSSEKWQSLLNSIPDYVVVVNRGGDILFVNQAPPKKEKEEVIGDNIRNYVYKKYHRVIENALEKVFGSGQNDFCEVEGPGFDLEDGWYEIRIGPLYRKGRVEYALMIGRDETSKKLTQEQLKFTDFSVERSAIATFWLDSDGTVFRVNDSACKALGYSSEELMAMSVRDFDLSWARDEWLEFWRNLSQKKFIRTDSHYWSKDGRIFPVEVNSNFFEYKGESYCFAFALDVGQRKEAEEALKKSEVRYRHLANSIGDIFFALDRDLRFTFWNWASERLTGISTREALGMSLFEIFPVVRGDNVHRLYKEVLETGKPQSFDDEYTFNDQKYFFEICLYPSSDGISVFARDCTDKNKMRSELKKHQDKLEVLVGERTARLKAINKRLELEIIKRKQVEKNLRGSRSSLRALLESNESVREDERRAIARELHDELGAMLTALKMNVNLLPNQLEDAQKEIAAFKENLNQHLDNAIEEVRRISKELRPPMLDELGLAAAIRMQTREFHKRSGIACNLDIIPEDIVLDPKYSTVFFRVYQELLTNIARHAQATEIWVNLKKEPYRITLAVVDNGVGIPQKKVVDPNSIGLIGMQERVHLVKGKVIIRGKKNIGTKVIVSVPISGELGSDTLGGLND